MVKQATLASFFGASSATSGAAGGRKQKSPSRDSIDNQEKKTNLEPSTMAKVTDASVAHDGRLCDTDEDDDDSGDRPTISLNSKKEKPSAETSSRNSRFEKEIPSKRKRQKIIEEDTSDEEMDDLETQEESEFCAIDKQQKNALKASITRAVGIAKETQNEEDYVYQDDLETNDESEDDDESLDRKETTTRYEPNSDSSKKTNDDHAPAIKQVAQNSSSSNNGNKTNAASSAAALLSCSDSILSDKSCVPNSPIPYSVLCKTLADIESITSRLKIQQHLTNLFRLCLLKNPKDLISLIYLASNTVAAAYQCVELGIGDSILIKAIGEAGGSNPSMIKQKYQADGDLGTVAMTAKGKQQTLGFGIKPKPLAANEVLSVFRQIAMTTGAQSQKWKISKIKGLLVRVQDPIESKYIIRGLQGKLRIGLAQSTVLISLAHAVLLSGAVEEPRGGEEVVEVKEKQRPLSPDSKNVRNKKLALEVRLESAVNIVKKAYSEVSSFDAVVDALLIHPLSILNEKCTLKPGIPVEPMLAKPTKSIQEVLKRLNGKRFTCEFKYDGERAQVHMDGNGVTKVFSRSLLDTSEKFPEVPMYVMEACKNVDSFVLDTEVVAYNRETKQFVPFQVLSTRKKTEESEENAKVKVIVQAFDLMYLNGKSLLDCPLSERRELLRKHFQPVDGKFQFATSLDHTENGDTTILEEFLDTAVKGQCEGLMVKTLDENASYQPSYRSLNWLKLKKDYLEGMGDSFDLVPIGAYHGKGKRTGVYGAYLLACYDVDTEEFQSVCKIGTGFSDEDLKLLTKGLNENIIGKKSTQYNVSSTLECDVWFEACQVWEVKAADLSKSSTHRGAVDKTGESSRGIGLRFPRFERLRDDKRPDQATTSDQILEMYYAQDSIGGAGGGFDDDGF
eukprot:CAMPEP_0176492004 /NCGR_PEP_ID=MMETSP0200_2-20121128/8741_1 /TAXON_ID=947934 /ORGANISM="Chaetoceros sp., Strain GSL56" /LENGTH=902 /DNA_ID=CAMNT_0017889485 /DNA_START=4405 /DNA_END=7113 /DNA_ORIENTATION=-